MGPQPEFPTELRRTGEHGRVPALEALAQHGAELAMHRARAGMILHAHPVGRIGAQESRASGVALGQRRGIGEWGDAETDPRLDPGTHGVLAGTAHCGGITILAAHRDTARGTAPARVPDASSSSRAHSGASCPRQPRKPK